MINVHILVYFAMYNSRSIWWAIWRVQAWQSKGILVFILIYDYNWNKKKCQKVSLCAKCHLSARRNVISFSDLKFYNGLCAYWLIFNRIVCVCGGGGFLNNRGCFQERIGSKITHFSIVCIVELYNN